jgi:hypothetical protein
MNEACVVGLQAREGQETRAAEILDSFEVDSAPGQTLWMVVGPTGDFNESRQIIMARLDELARDWQDALIVLDLPPEDSG